MRNAAEHVLEQVRALANQAPATIDFEVIWVDNGSSDGTLRLVADSIRDDTRMRVVSAPEVRSSFFARNRGVAHAQADVFLFCDADDVVDQHWVRSMASALADLDVVGGALVSNADGSVAVEVTAPAHHFLPAGATANMGVRRGAFEALGGFNSLIRSGEDVALCWRAQVRGLRFGFAPDATVLYRRRKTEWARMGQWWIRGRWYREWASPFVDLGADAPTIAASLRRIVNEAIRPAMRHPRRWHARVALWNLAVISSCLVRPRRPST